MKKIKFHIMDHTGHTTVDFKKEGLGVEDAMTRFREILAGGHSAFKKDPSTGNRVQIRAFDPAAEDVLFIPQLKGG